MSKPLDVLLVTPPSRVQVYQELSRDFAAIEPPVWSGLIATFLRQHCCSVAILDAEAQGLNHEQTAQQIAAIVASEQQSVATQQIASDIENVEKVTKESSSGAHESAKASQDLSQLAVELQGIVGGFKI